MTDKQIIIDYENLCENYSKEVGCYNTFDGSCIKEQCFTYRILQLLKAKEQECEELKKLKTATEEASELFVKNADEIARVLENKLDQLKKTNEELQKENEELKKQHQGDKGLITSTGKMNYQLIQEYDKLKNCLTEIKEIAEKSCCLQPTSTCEEYENCKECSRTSDDETVKQILQKISECEVE